jgi:parallel beta-helix repeat protein
MEPKSIAFYTAVAVSILAVLSATTFPTLVQAQQPTDNADDEEDIQAQAAEAESEAMTEEDNGVNEEEETEEEAEEDPKDDNGAASQNLGLTTNGGVASCGETIMEDVTLTSDLNCGPGDGLTVAASGVTINLNGYSISSSDEAGSEDLSMDYDGSSGILVANADDVDITGLGEIDGFDRGITFMGSSGGHVTDLQLANNGIGVLISGSESIEISRDTLTNNGIAVISDSSNHGVIAFNQVVANLEQGMLFLGSDMNTVAANNMFGNGDNGIYLDILSNENKIDYNTVFSHEVADLNNANGQPINVNQNIFGDNNNCGTSLPGGLCR